MVGSKAEAQSKDKLYNRAGETGALRFLAIAKQAKNGELGKERVAKARKLAGGTPAQGHWQGQGHWQR